MKKLIIVILAIMLCGCRSHTKKDFRTEDASQIETSETMSEETDDDEEDDEDEADEEIISADLSSYYGTYYQDEIAYVNEDDYAKETDYHFPGFKYVIKAKSFTFETDLIYDEVSYVEQEITKEDRDIVMFATKKYAVYSEGEAIGVTILIDEHNLYIANDAKYHEGYTYVAKMITEKERDERQKAQKEAEEAESES